ncbi:MAG: hypothetical protein RLZZ628_916 [Bacteroidota bacterium]|jgi:hypothetical protein
MNIQLIDCQIVVKFIIYHLSFIIYHLSFIIYHYLALNYNSKIKTNIEL